MADEAGRGVDPVAVLEAPVVAAAIRPTAIVRSVPTVHRLNDCRRRVLTRRAAPPADKLTSAWDRVLRIESDVDSGLLSKLGWVSQ